MQERLTYRNHMNETIDFGNAGIYVKGSDLHDYSWTISQKNNRISGFKRAVSSKSLPVIIHASTPEEGVDARNRLMEIAEKDILAQQPGRLIIGDYYLTCYITASKKTSYLKSLRRMDTTLTITTDRPYWVRETLSSFRKNALENAWFDYPFDYSYDYASSLISAQLNNGDFTATNFRMTFFGPCANPAVHIAGHIYRVACTAESGELIVVDSAEKTIRKIARNGAETNAFNLRDRTSYIFQKIPPGISQVSWDGEFGVDVTLLEERSEPKWT